MQCRVDISTDMPQHHAFVSPVGPALRFLDSCNFPHTHSRGSTVAPAAWRLLAVADYHRTSRQTSIVRKRTERAWVPVQTFKTGIADLADSADSD